MTKKYFPLDIVPKMLYNISVNKAELSVLTVRLRLNGQYALALPMSGDNCVLYGCGFLCTHFFFFFYSRRCLTISKQELQINEEIRDKEVLVIDAEGKKLGVLSAKEAQKLAFEQDLDLVKIAPQATPPVCRIMDYGKFCFEQAKREKEARKNQKVVSIKEIRMFSTIDTHDFETKVNQAVKFLQGGDKLKVSVRFRKRAIAHPELGNELLDRFKEAVSSAGTVDKPAKMEGRSIVMFVSPKTNK